MTPWMYDLLKIFLAALLVLINGFFVGAEFALIKIRKSRLEEMQAEGRPFSSTASWLIERLDASLSACQLGITMASLGLGMNSTMNCRNLSVRDRCSTLFPATLPLIQSTSVWGSSWKHPTRTRLPAS